MNKHTQRHTHTTCLLYMFARKYKNRIINIMELFKRYELENNLRIYLVIRKSFLVFRYIYFSVTKLNQNKRVFLNIFLNNKVMKNA